MWRAFHYPSAPLILSIAFALSIAVIHFDSCSATTVLIDWVEQSILSSSIDPFPATSEELPVIFPEFPALYSDTTWQSYLKLSKRALSEVEAFKSIKYTPGIVFKHRLFGYRGVIMHGTPNCEASEQWIQQMRVDELPGGRNQPFYWSMVDVRDRPVQTTYVAQSNIVPVHTQVLHPDISTIFRSYQVALGRYVPLDRSIEEVLREVRCRSCLSAPSPRLTPHVSLR
jgi:hemimethylated DNA binding protein